MALSPSMISFNKSRYNNMNNVVRQLESLKKSKKVVIGQSHVYLKIILRTNKPKTRPSPKCWKYTNLVPFNLFNVFEHFGMKLLSIINIICCNLIC
jgi:hypothetical protein